MRQLLGITPLPGPSSIWTRRQVLRVWHLTLRPTPTKTFLRGGRVVGGEVLTAAEGYEVQLTK